MQLVRIVVCVLLVLAVVNAADVNAIRNLRRSQVYDKGLLDSLLCKACATVVQQVKGKACSAICALPLLVPFAGVCQYIASQNCDRVTKVVADTLELTIPVCTELGFCVPDSNMAIPDWNNKAAVAQQCHVGQGVVDVFMGDSYQGFPPGAACNKNSDCCMPLNTNNYRLNYGCGRFAANKGVCMRATTKAGDSCWNFFDCFNLKEPLVCMCPSQQLSVDMANKVCAGGSTGKCVKASSYKQWEKSFNTLPLN